MPDFHVAMEDAFGFLKTLPDKSCDLLITDLPYPSLEKWRKIGTTTRLKQSKGSSNDWFEVISYDRFEELFAQCFRVLKKHTHMYFYCDQETMFVTKPIAEKAGFKFHKFLVWDKMCMGMGYHYRAQHELILFLEKGKRKINDLGIPDVLTVKRIWKGYPTEKPVELNRIMVHQSSQPGEIVLDPFMGSGSVGVAALNKGRRFIGVDTAPDAFTLTQKRLVEAQGTEKSLSELISLR